MGGLGLLDKCEIDHSFDGSENQIGLRSGEEGPSPPHTSEKYRLTREKEYQRLKKLTKN